MVKNSTGDIAEVFVECPLCRDMFLPKRVAAWIEYNGERLCDRCEAAAPHVREAVGSEVTSLPHSRAGVV